MLLIASLFSSCVLAQDDVYFGSLEKGLSCRWNASFNAEERISLGCGFTCAGPWGPYSSYKAWKAQADLGLTPDGDWEEVLAQTHFCGSPTTCCCRPECNIEKLSQDSFIGVNWSDKYMRYALPRKKQFEVLRHSGFYHIKTFSHSGLREMLEIYGEGGVEEEGVSMMLSEKLHVYVGVPNRELSTLSSSVEDCKKYISDNILKYKSIVKMLIVGNEPFLCIKTEDWAKKGECGSLQVPAKLLPAMKNMREAALLLGWDVPVSSAFNGGIMDMNKDPWTPCVAQFKPFILPLLEPIWSFLASQTVPAPFIVNIYSWFAALSGHIRPHFATGFYEEHQRDERGNKLTKINPYTGETEFVDTIIQFDGDYDYMFNYDMQVDMQRVAMCKNRLHDIPIWIGETGWPSGGDDLGTYRNQWEFTKAVIKRGIGEYLGPKEKDTPRWGGVPHTVFLFEAFNEEKKFEIEHGNKFENEFGIFHEDGTPKWVDENGELDLNLPLIGKWKPNQ